MSPSRSPSGTPLASSLEDQLQDLRVTVPSSNRNSWIYNPTSVAPSSMAAQADSKMESSIHHRGPNTPQTSSSGAGLQEDVSAAVNVLAEMDFVESVRLLCEKNRLSREEAMRLLYNAFQAVDAQTLDRQTQSERLRQHSSATMLTPGSPSGQLPLQLLTESSDSGWKSVNTAIHDPLSLTYPPNHDTLPRGFNNRQTLTASPSLPTFPSEQMAAATRTVRGATFSNAYKTDGTALDQRFATPLNLLGSNSALDGHYLFDNESVEPVLYDPTASTFTPTGSRHMMTRSTNADLRSSSAAPDGVFASFNRTVGLPPGLLEKRSELQLRSPPAKDINVHNGSGLSLTPSRSQHDQTLSGVPVPASLNHGGTEQKRFIPMNAALKERACAVPDPALYLKPPMQTLPNTNFSERYLGQHTESNASANISEDYNCAIWMRNLPPNVTYKELLGSIKGAGRVWCSYINMPDFEKHHTAAAKVVFYRPESARAFLKFTWTQYPEIRGFPIKADLNRIRSAPHSLSEQTSRVLIITGEDWFAEEAYLKEWFGQQCQFQIDHIVTHIQAHGRAVVEFRFGSYRSQAEAGFKALTINRPKGFQKVEFGDDPCEVGETFSAKAIALQRFQGIGL